MDNKEIMVSVEVVEDIFSEDVRYSLRKKFGFDFENGDEFYEIPRSFGVADSEPIDIDEAITILQRLKSKNSTHVQIEYHSDHQEYIFSGMKIELATDDLIAKYKEYWVKRKELETLVNSKELEIREIKKQIKNL
jgi:hypothetical protein